nr:MAG: hypothetical protein H3RhizoLitter14551_000001 [Mitovirus sp.]
MELSQLVTLSMLLADCPCPCDLWIHHRGKTGLASSYHPLPTLRNYLVAYARTLTSLNLIGRSTWILPPGGDPNQGLSRSRAGARYPFMNFPLPFGKWLPFTSM